MSAFDPKRTSAAVRGLACSSVDLLLSAIKLVPFPREYSIGLRHQRTRNRDVAVGFRNQFHDFGFCFKCPRQTLSRKVRVFGVKFKWQMVIDHCGAPRPVTGGSAMGLSATDA